MLQYFVLFETMKWSRYNGSIKYACWWILLVIKTTAGNLRSILGKSMTLGRAWYHHHTNSNFQLSGVTLVPQYHIVSIPVLSCSHLSTRSDIYFCLDSWSTLWRSVKGFQRQWQKLKTFCYQCYQVENTIQTIPLRPQQKQQCRSSQLAYSFITCIHANTFCMKPVHHLSLCQN